MRKKLEKPFFKRVFATGLALCMLFSMMPKLASVHAAEGAGGTNLALAATVDSNVVGLSDNSKNGIHDGNKAAGLWRNSTTDVYPAKDYYQLTWSEAVSVNQVALSAKDKSTAPVSWHVEVSTDGTAWSNVAGITDVTWTTNNSTAETKTMTFATKENIKALRVYIDAVKFNSYGYGFTEIEVYNVSDAVVDTTPVVSNNLGESAIISASSNVSDGGKKALPMLKDGSSLTSFFRSGMTATAQDVTGTVEDYYQFTWENPVSVNQVDMAVVNAGCQAPTSWHVEVSTDGTTWTKVASIADVNWEGGFNDIQTKKLTFDLQENVKGLRVYIDKAYLLWSGYGIVDLEVYKVENPEGNQPGGSESGDNESAGNKTEPVAPPNGNYALIATVTTEMTLSDAAKETFGRINDGKHDNAFFRVGDAATIEGKDYYQFNWESPVSVNQIKMVVTRAGCQAPTSWHVEVSTDGTTGWTKVASISDVNWPGGFEDIHTKNLGFALQKDIKGLRVYIDKANLEWNGYGINEIEIYEASSPKSGDDMLVAPIMFVLVISATGVVIGALGYRKNRKYI